jgi:hypothetical protein
LPSRRPRRAVRFCGDLSDANVWEKITDMDCQTPKSHYVE